MPLKCSNAEKHTNLVYREFFVIYEFEVGRECISEWGVAKSCHGYYGEGVEGPAGRIEYVPCSGGGTEDYDGWRVDTGDFREGVEWFVKGAPKC